MKVKRYRAATMRDALEQVKSELGEDALVLGSKSLKRKGFLGFGARDLVEVRVSANVATTQDEERSLPAVRKPTFTSLSLHDTPAVEVDGRNKSGFSALAARAYATESLGTNAPSVGSHASSKLGAHASSKLGAHASSRASFETRTPFELDSRVTSSDTLLSTQVQERIEPVVKTQSSETGTSKTETSAVKRDTLIVELERLRSEVREIKFTLTNNTRSSVSEISAPTIIDGDDEIYDSPYYETYLELAKTGLSPEIARSAVRSAIASGATTNNIHELARIGLVNILPTMIDFGADPLAPRISETSSQAVIALVGPTGVGKTTTIAKLAARAALRERKRVELITLDTYRIAAVDQLRTYAEIIGAGFHVPRSILELDALVQRFSGTATVLIDTIGRSARDLADQLELADYLRNNEQITKLLAVQATTHPTDATLAIEKFGLFGVNEMVITKLDETGRPGAAICTAAAGRLPLAYLCTGQRVPEDIEKASAESLATYVLQSTTAAMAA